jgi:hypothetical protein
MAGLAFTEFDALEDVLATDRFELLVEPQGQNGLNQTLAVRCTQIVVPQVMIEQMVVSIQGMEFNFRGRRTYDKTIGATFVETTDARVNTGIRTWMERVVGSESQNGANKKGYSTVGSLNVIDQSGNTNLGFEIINMWPQEMPQVQLDGSQAQPYLAQATFSFDRVLQNGVAIM